MDNIGTAGDRPQGNGVPHVTLNHRCCALGLRLTNAQGLWQEHYLDPEMAVSFMASMGWAVHGVEQTVRSQTFARELHRLCNTYFNTDFAGVADFADTNIVPRED